MAARKICVVTGSRADYGLLYWLLRELQKASAVELQLVVTGSHLAPEFGATVSVIEMDKMVIAARVEMLLSTDTHAGMAKSVGIGVAGFSDAFVNLKPDLVLVLGDRFEIFAAAQAATISGIPLAHIHGGEVTEGAIDEQMRHAITKLAHLHFVSAEGHRRRVIQMGENPACVHLVGAPGLDNVAFLKLLDRTATEKLVGMKLREPVFLATYHPATLGALSPELAMKELLDALDMFPSSSVVLTMPNADAGGRAVGALAMAHAKANEGRVAFVKSLGQTGYLSMMSHADVIVGNSSSGLIEAPALRRPTVNIGSRQQGRLRSESVIDCEENAAAIGEAIARALTPKMRAVAARSHSAYGTPGKISKAIAEVLAGVDLVGLTHKRFFDLAVPA